MNDERYVAKQTERERKSLAASARRRKTHNGKSGCNFNHEKLTKKELEKMNGEVKEYDLKNPMTWKEFKKLPSDIMEAYIYQLVRKYDISGKLFSQMLGITNPSFYKFMHAEHPAFLKMFNSSKAYSPERKTKRDDFLMWAGLTEEKKPEVSISMGVDDVKEEKKAPIEVPLCEEALKAKSTRAIFGPMPWEASAKIEVTNLELELMLLRQKVEIYERLIFGKEMD